MFSIIVSMFIWGTLGMFVLWSGLPMMDIAWSRCLIGGVVLAIFCYQQGLFKFERAHLKEVMLTIFSGIFLVLNWVLLFESFKYASITIGNVSYYLQPIFLVILGIFCFKEKVVFSKWVLIFLSFIGVILTTGLLFNHAGSAHGIIQPNERHLLIGVSCAVLAGILYALVTIIAKPIRHIPSPMVTLIQLMTGAVLLLPWVSYKLLASIQWQAGFYLILMGIVHTALAYMLYYNGIKKVSVTTIAVLSHIDPVVAIGTDILFFHQHLDLLQITGILITLISSYLVIAMRSK